MVRRHIVENSEIQEICRRIYEKHKRALDVIFEHRPDRASEIASVIREQIAKRAGIIEDHCTKSYIRFIPKILDFIPLVGDGWTPTKRLLLFEVENYQGKLTFRIILGPGPQEIRREVHEVVTQHSRLFNRSKQKLYPKYWSFHSESWLGVKRYTEISLQDLETELAGRFDALLEDKVPMFASALEPLRDRYRKDNT